MSTQEQANSNQPDVESVETTQDPTQDRAPDTDAAAQDSGADPSEAAEGLNVDAFEGQPEGAEGGHSDAQQIEALQAELAQQKEEVLRAHAEMQNVRRRVERDIDNARKYALEKFVGELLSVVDNLERAIAAIDKNDDALTAVGEGVELTLKNFLDVLSKFNVEQVDPTGEAFDPEKHQAMTMVPNPEVAANTVIEVFQKGYLLNGRLIRPAMVVVSQG